MVRSKNQTTEQFPFISNQSKNQNNFKSDRVDRLLSKFALAFFGIILLAISFDNSLDNTSTFSSKVKTSSAAKIVTAKNITSKKENTLSSKTKNLSTVSKKESKKIPPTNFKAVPKPILVSSKIDDSKKVERINQPVSYSSQPTFKTFKATKVAIKPQIKKVIYNPIVRKTTSTKVNPISKKSTNKLVSTKVNTKKTESNKKLTINSQITEDLLPSSYFAAKQKANQDGKPMLIKFGAKWCLPCREMEKSTFKNAQVVDFMKSNYVTLSIDVDDFDGYNLKAYYNIAALPTILVFNAQGEFLAKYINSMSTSKFMSVLKTHQSKSVQPSIQKSVFVKNETPSKVTSKNVTVPSTLNKKETILATVELNKVVVKKKNGQAITTLKNKAKNWRSTSLEIAANNLTSGQLIVNLRNLTTGEILNENSIPLKFHNNDGTITDTTSIYQLDISHEKKKDKLGEYVIEIYHATPQKVRLIGKTSFLKDGKFIWKK